MSRTDYGLSASRCLRISPPSRVGDPVGEKGNITAEELAARASSEAGGLGAVVAGSGTTVTAVFSDTTEKLQDKLIDKGIDAGIDSYQEKRAAGRKDAAGEADSDPGT